MSTNCTENYGSVISNAPYVPSQKKEKGYLLRNIEKINYYSSQSKFKQRNPLNPISPSSKSEKQYFLSAEKKSGCQRKECDPMYDDYIRSKSCSPKKSRRRRNLNYDFVSLNGSLSLNDLYEQTKSILNGGRLVASGKFLTRIGLVSKTLQNQKIRVLYLGSNSISKLGGIEQFEDVETISLGGNLISDINQIQLLQQLTKLKVLYLVGNPVCELPHYRNHVIRMLPNLDFLDSKKVTTQEKKDSDSISRHDESIRRMLLGNHCHILALQRTATIIQLHKELLLVVCGRPAIYKCESIDAIYNWKFKVDYYVRLCLPHMQQDGKRIERKLVRVVSRTRGEITNPIKRKAVEFLHKLSIEKPELKIVHDDKMLSWDQAYATVLLIQQSTISRLVGLCEEKNIEAKEIFESMERKDSKGFVEECRDFDYISRKQFQQEREALVAEYQDILHIEMFPMSLPSASNSLTYSLPPQQDDPEAFLSLEELRTDTSSQSTIERPSQRRERGKNHRVVYEKLLNRCGEFSKMTLNEAVAKFQFRGDFKSSKTNEKSTVSKANPAISSNQKMIRKPKSITKSILTQHDGRPKLCNIEAINEEILSLRSQLKEKDDARKLVQKINNDLSKKLNLFQQENELNVNEAESHIHRLEEELIKSKKRQRKLEIRMELDKQKIDTISNADLSNKIQDEKAITKNHQVNLGTNRFRQVAAELKLRTSQIKLPTASSPIPKSSSSYSHPATFGQENPRNFSSSYLYLNQEMNVQEEDHVNVECPRKVLEMFRRNRLQRFLYKWIASVLITRRLNKIRKRILHRHMIQSFSRWRKQLRRCHQYHRMVMRREIKMEKLVLRRWKRFLLGNRRKALIYKQLHQYRTHCRLRRVFLRWKQHAVQLQQQEAIEDRLQHHHSNRCLITSLAYWKLFCETRKRDLMLQQVRLVERTRFRFLKVHFQAWKMIRFCLLHAKFSTKRMRWNTWKNKSIQHRQQEEYKMICDCFKLKKWMKRWHEYIFKKITKYDRNFKCNTFQLGKMWKKWKLFQQKKRKEECKQMIALKHYFIHLLKTHWLMWHENFNQSKYKENCLVSSSFQQWIRYLLKQQYLHRLDKYIIIGKLEYMRRFYSQWVKWHQATRLNRRIYGMVQHIQRKKILSTYMGCWRNWLHRLLSKNYKEIHAKTKTIEEELNNQMKRLEKAVDEKQLIILETNKLKKEKKDWQLELDNTKEMVLELEEVKNKIQNELIQKNEINDKLSKEYHQAIQEGQNQFQKALQVSEDYKIILTKKEEESLLLVQQNEGMKKALLQYEEKIIQTSEQINQQQEENEKQNLNIQQENVMLKNQLKRETSRCQEMEILLEQKNAQISKLHYELQIHKERQDIERKHTRTFEDIRKTIVSHVPELHQLHSPSMWNETNESKPNHQEESDQILSNNQNDNDSAKLIHQEIQNLQQRLLNRLNHSYRTTPEFNLMFQTLTPIDKKKTSKKKKTIQLKRSLSNRSNNSILSKKRIPSKK